MLPIGECPVGEDGILVAEVVVLVDLLHWRVTSGVRGHLAHDCPGTSTQLLTLSGGSSGPTRGRSFKSGQSGPKKVRVVVGKFDLGK